MKASIGWPGRGSGTQRIIGYLRVSTDEQAESGAGLGAQRQSIAAEAERSTWTVKWIIDGGFSAKDLNRPGIVEALDLLKAGEADTLAVAKLDRLSRSLLDFAGLMERSRKEGWSIVARGRRMMETEFPTPTPYNHFPRGPPLVNRRPERTRDPRPVVLGEDTPAHAIRHRPQEAGRSPGHIRQITDPGSDGPIRRTSTASRTTRSPAG